MKELTTEQKAQRYNEALEKAKDFYKGYKQRDNQLYADDLESIFPELKKSEESEDERIRKSLIDMLKNDEKHYLKEIAWLEKIGKNTTNKGESNLLTHERAMEISPFMRSGFENEDKVEPKFHKEDWVVWDNKISCHVDNIYQGKNSLMYTITDTNNMTRSYSVKGFDNNAHLWTINDAKDGDVLIFEGFYNSIVLFQGIGINGKGRINYHCKCDLGNYSFDVQGDVACLGTVERDAEHYHPATKEQRDLLFQKMKEAGYEWDSENRELMKIDHKKLTDFQEGLRGILIESNGKYDDNTVLRLSEQVLELVGQKQEWSEEDSEHLDSIIESYKDLMADYKASHDVDYIPYDSNTVVRTVTNDVNFLESLKDKVQPQTKQGWSQEDEYLIWAIPLIINTYPKQEMFYGYSKEKLISWLKSLKDRYTWKPSKEQMEYLHKYAEQNNYDGAILTSLYKDLKQLKQL